LFVSPTWAATSLVESPQLIGNAMCVIVQAAVADSMSHWIVVGIDAVETDEPWPFTLVGAGAGLPLGSASIASNPGEGRGVA
jgi:hypothetical protein